MFLPLNVQGFLKFDLSKADKGREAGRTWAEGVRETGEEKKKGWEAGCYGYCDKLCGWWIRPKLSALNMIG